MTATKPLPAVSTADSAELFAVLWSFSDGDHWHIGLRRNGKQAIASSLEKAEAFMAEVVDELRIKKHTTGGARVMIVRQTGKAFTKPQ